MSELLFYSIFFMLWGQRRFEQYVARGGQAGPAAVEAPAAAIRGALRYVQAFNACALLSGAQTAVAEAWLQLTQVCVCVCACLNVSACECMCAAASHPPRLC